MALAKIDYLKALGFIAANDEPTWNTHEYLMNGYIEELLTVQLVAHLFKRRPKLVALDILLIRQGRAREIEFPLKITKP